MDVLLYARVSTEAQSGEGQVSIQQQISDMHALVDRQGWRILSEFIDSENYIASMPPNKGKVVNPSGERADRPALLGMLEEVKSGNVDAVICWRDDRLVRHPRVAVALEDALDLGDGRRNGRGKVQIYDATGAVIDRFTLSIKATIWREENKRRVERSRMGKIGTLKEGKWPGSYNRLGYRSVKDPGKRGTTICLSNDEEIQTVQDIFNWYEAGYTIYDIRDRLIARGDRQMKDGQKRVEWHPAYIARVLHAREYIGEATWDAGDGTLITINVPVIISAEQWERVQMLLKKRHKTSIRNASDVYLIQGIAFCGECGCRMGVARERFVYGKMKDGTIKRYDRKTFLFRYRCQRAQQKFQRGDHPHPFIFSGPNLDWAIWRTVVDQGIKNPEYIREQILRRQTELRNQGESLESQIARMRLRLSKIAEERAAYQRMLARKRITEIEFDSRMDETTEAVEFLQSELAQLIDLRDDQQKVDAGIRYAQELFNSIHEDLAEIDLSPKDMELLPLEQRHWIMEMRQKVIRALVDKVLIYADGRVVLEGVLDGTEICQFGSLTPEMGSQTTESSRRCAGCSRPVG